MKKILSISLVSVLAFGLSAQTLDDYLNIAAENNPGLKAKYAQFEASMQRSAQVAQMPNPTLSFGYFILPVETRIGPQQAKIGLSQMFPWFGTLRSRGDAAAHMAEAKYYEFIDARENLYQSVKTAYYKLLENKGLKNLEEENLEILRTLRELSLSKYENDKGSLADVYRVDVMIDESETRIQLLEEQKPTLETLFNKLLNREAQEPVALTDTLLLQEDTIQLAPADFSGHPKQLSITEMKTSSAASEQAAKRAGYPGIGLGIDYVFVGDRTDMAVPNSGKDALMPMVSISLPIYRKGYHAARTESQKMQEAFASQSIEVENNLENQWAKVRYDQISAKTDHDLLQRQINKTETIIELLLSQYGNDNLGFEELLREQQKLLSFKKKQVKVKADYLIAVAGLEYLQHNAKTLNNE